MRHPVAYVAQSVGENSDLSVFVEKSEKLPAVSFAGDYQPSLFFKLFQNFGVVSFALNRLCQNKPFRQTFKIKTEILKVALTLALSRGHPAPPFGLACALLKCTSVEFLGCLVKLSRAVHKTGYGFVCKNVFFPDGLAQSQSAKRSASAQSDIRLSGSKRPFSKVNYNLVKCLALRLVDCHCPSELKRILIVRAPYDAFHFFQSIVVSELNVVPAVSGQSMRSALGNFNLYADVAKSNHYAHVAVHPPSLRIVTQE